MTDLMSGFANRASDLQRQRDYLMNEYLCGRLMASQTAWLILESIKVHTHDESDQRTNALKELCDFLDLQHKSLDMKMSVGNLNRLTSVIDDLMPSSDTARNQSLVSYMGMSLA